MKDYRELERRLLSVKSRSKGDLLREAAAALTTLAAQLEELQAKYDRLNRFDTSQSYNLLAKNTKLRAELEQVKREREAMREDLRGYCWCCAHGSRYVKAPIWSNMTTCKYMRDRGAMAIGGGRGGKNCPHWEWRGPKKET